MTLLILKTRFILIALPFFLVKSEYTNLPEVPPGIFEAGTRTEIKTTVAAAWETLNNFREYAAWNPFVRYAVVISPLNLTLPEQRPIEGKRLFMRTQTPPLPLPVDKNTPDNPLNTQFTYERITHVQPDLKRLAWIYLPEALLQAERWQALSDIGNGTVLYESREVFHGLLAETLKATLGQGLQKSFDAQGQGLKLFLEREATSG